MIRPSPAPSLARFRVLVADRLGLSFDSTRSEALSEALERRSRAQALAVPSYLDQLERLQAGAVELSNLGAELTVGETYFFRHVEQLQAFSEVALPERRATLGEGRPIRILSAGCASGEEAYSLAILAGERGLVGAGAPDILGIDLNPLSIGRAERAVYSEWALRDTQEEVRLRYFRKEGSAYRLLKSRLPTVRFRRANLVDNEAVNPGTVDILFCRNVLMYFTRDQAIRTLERLAAAISPGGYLFLGHAETLHGLSSDFDLLQARGAFYYRKKAPPGAASIALAGHNWLEPSLTSDRTPASSKAGALPPLQSLIDDVERSSQRLRALGELEARKAPPSERTPGGASGPVAMRSITKLIENERFDQALELVAKLEATDVDADHLVLRAALLTHSGRLEAAEQTCLSILARNERNAPAHYLLALLRERQGKPDVAIEHDEIATLLDPTFAMPHLHLGLVMVRRSNAGRARSAFRQAIFLLEKEDAQRLLLFGGGFERASLIRLCQQELARLGGAS